MQTSMSVYSKLLSKGENQYSVDAQGDAYWRHLENTIKSSECAAMRPYVKLL